MSDYTPTTEEVRELAERIRGNMRKSGRISTAPRRAPTLARCLTHSLDLTKEQAMSDRTCTFEGCGRKLHSRGWCSAHYMQNRRGQSLRPVYDPDDPYLRIMAKVHKTDWCWHWTANRATNGYGRVSVRGKSAAAHRAIYELYVGSIPDGLELDHLCRNRACVNPDHLEPVTHRENTLRGNTITAIAARTTHCPAGHALVDGNLVPSSLKQGRRDCLTCSRERARKRRAARKEQAD